MINGRIIPNNNNNNNKSFQHCNNFRDQQKQQRIATQKQKRLQHRNEILKKKLQYMGKIKGGIPKIIAVVPLSKYANVHKVTKTILKYFNINDGHNVEHKNPVQFCAKIGSQNYNYTIWECNRDNNVSMLDVCKIADIMFLVASPSPDLFGDDSVATFSDELLGFDDKTRLICKFIRNNGLPNIFGLFQPGCQNELNYLAHQVKLQSKVDKTVVNCFLKFLNFEFGMNNFNNKIFHCYDVQQIFRFVLTTKYCETNWKYNRAHLLAHNIEYNNNTNQLKLTGYLRGQRPLNIHRPIHITGYNDYLISNVYLYNNDMRINVDPSKQDKIQPLLPLNTLATQNDQSIITDEEIRELKISTDDDDDNKNFTSKYYAKWDNNLINSNDKDSDIEVNDVDMNDSITNLIKKKEMEMDNDDDGRMPDEVDTPINVRAKDEFCEYRGLQNFWKDKWDKFESLPLQYSQIFNINDWKQACKLSKTIENINKNNDDNHLIECNQKIDVIINNVNKNDYIQMVKHDSPVILWNLLKYETKISVSHYLIKKSNTYNDTLQELNEYLFDSGFRRFNGKPIFTDNTKCDKHLTIKTINDNNEYYIMSIYAPICYPPINILIFNNDNKFDNILGNGYLTEINAHRILIERKILTGRPVKIHRRRAIVRYMFWNPKDVRYFMPLNLWTKHGLKGKIEQSVGDQGYMKCFFSGKLKQNDTICLSLYKRVFPQF